MFYWIFIGLNNLSHLFICSSFTHLSSYMARMLRPEILTSSFQCYILICWNSVYNIGDFRHSVTQKWINEWSKCEPGENQLKSGSWKKKNRFVLSSTAMPKKLFKVKKKKKEISYKNSSGEDKSTIKNFTWAFLHLTLGCSMTLK